MLADLVRQSSSLRASYNGILKWELSKDIGIMYGL